MDGQLGQSPRPQGIPGAPKFPARGAIRLWADRSVSQATARGRTVVRTAGGQPLLIGRIFRLRHPVPLDCGASTSVLVQSPANSPASPDQVEWRRLAAVQ